jgi:hypothetical protein
MKLEFSRQTFEKYSDTTFHKNRPSESRVVPRGRTDGQNDMAKLTAAYSNFANVPKNSVRTSQRTQGLQSKTIRYLRLGKEQLFIE